MKKIILVPDSFKSTMSSLEVCAIMRECIIAHYPDANIVSIPVADGGEGSVDCFLQAVGGTRETVIVKGPFMEDMDSYYGRIGDGEIVIVEMAACAGLPLVEHRMDPLNTTTYGVGQLIICAAERGAKKIIVGLGGSATNDGGCGAACAAGIRFYNAAGESFIPTGGTLKDIMRIDTSGRKGCGNLLGKAEIIAMCDIDNPMYGSTGAARIFGPQKGADSETVELLDNGVKHLAGVIERDFGMNLAEQPGTGAAGAMGAGMIAFFGAKLQMGIEVVLDTVHFDEELRDANMVLTGEGKIDTQSLRGKVVIGVARRAKAAGVPVVAVVGDIGDGIEAVYDEGVSCILSINRIAEDFSKARNHARNDMALTVDNFMRFCKQMRIF